MRYFSFNLDLRQCEEPMRDKELQEKGSKKARKAG